MVLTLSDRPIPALPDFAHAGSPISGTRYGQRRNRGERHTLAPDCVRSIFTLSARDARLAGLRDAHIWHRSGVKPFQPTAMLEVMVPTTTTVHSPSARPKIVTVLPISLR